jgi:hypothetical protein
MTSINKQRQASAGPAHTRTKHNLTKRSFVEQLPMVSDGASTTNFLAKPNRQWITVHDKDLLNEGETRENTGKTVCAGPASQCALRRVDVKPIRAELPAHLAPDGHEHISGQPGKAHQC